MRFVYTRGEPRVYAWDLAEPLNPVAVDTARYCELLLRAASTVLQPFGLSESALHDRLIAGAWPQELFTLPGDWSLPAQYEVRAQLGNQCHYVVQPEPLGTGHAVLQLSAPLKDYPGNLLILYGGSPLFRPASIRGLLNRHALRQAHLTLLTAIADRPLPYGRIIRDAGGRIVDIIEETVASPAVREIRELNVGAYAVHTDDIFPVLEKLPPSPRDGEYRLTDCVHQLIRWGLVVESYQIYDQDEVQGINTSDDLMQAEFILQKRSRPAHPRVTHTVGRLK